MMNNFTIKLTLDGLKEQVVHAFHVHTTEIEEAIKEEMEKIVKNFDLKSVVRDAAEKAMNEAVRRTVSDYFTFGDGRKAIVEVIDGIVIGAKNATETPTDQKV